MTGWENFCGKIDLGRLSLEDLKKAADEYSGCRIYKDSLREAGGTLFFIAGDGESKKLIAFGEGEYFDLLSGREETLTNGKAKICELSNENCGVIRKIFPFTNPVNHRGIKTTIGLGDRLGLASPGHIRLIRDLDVFPVLAQQSIRELNLTGRTYDDVLAAASWAVFQEGYTKGFGADGDHLKTSREVKMALDCGFTMITLDCSEHIDNRIPSMSQADVDRLYLEIPRETRIHLEAKYLGREFMLEGGSVIKFSSDEFKKTVLIYLKAVNYTIDIYNNVIMGCGRPVDFEMSIDETLTSTSPESHYFVASELIAGGVEITSLAPRFCGEFQKGIDYRGDIAQFRSEFETHFRIAETFGYKISVHSGSDKFSVFPVIGEITGGRYHLKTAGTNWLEAVRIIAAKNPSLYRRMHKFAVKNLDEAKKYYHISADPSKIPDIDALSDSELGTLMDKEDSRQVLHITYGLILLAENPDGSPTFRSDIYGTLNEREEEYCGALQKHIGRHLSTLGVI